MMQKYVADHKYSGLLFVLVFMMYTLVYMTKNCYSAAMASIVDAGIMTKSQTGLIAACFYLVYAPFQIIGGFAADKYSPYKLVLIGMIGGGICNLLVYFTQNYIAMIIIWSLNAVVQFGIWPATFKIVSTQLSPDHRVKSSLYISLSNVSGLLLSYLCAICIGNWKNNFLVSALILFSFSLIFFFMYKMIEQKMEEMPALEMNNKKSVLKNEKGFLKLALQAGLPLLMIVAMIQTMLNLGLKSLTPVMLMESYEAVSPNLANGLNMILIVASPVGLFIAKNRFFQKFNTVLLIAFFFLLAIPLLLVITFLGQIDVWFIVSALTIMMVVLTAISTMFSYVSLSFGVYGRSGTVSGLINCMASLGIVLANYVFATLADLKGWGITTQCWLWIGIFALGCSVVTVPIWKKFRKMSL